MKRTTEGVLTTLALGALAVFLGVVLLVSVVLIIFAVPAKMEARKYDKSLYQLTDSVENADGSYYAVYVGVKYSSVENLQYNSSKVEHEVISWSYGFPFHAILSYSSYTKDNPDYIVADWIGEGEIMLSENYPIEKISFSIDFLDEDVGFNDICDDKMDMDLSRYVALSSFEMQDVKHPELSLSADIHSYNSTYFVSFDRKNYYLINSEFVALLVEKGIISDYM